MKLIFQDSISCWLWWHGYVVTALLYWLESDKPIYSILQWQIQRRRNQMNVIKPIHSTIEKCEYCDIFKCSSKWINNKSWWKVKLKKIIIKSVFVHHVHDAGAKFHVVCVNQILANFREDESNRCLILSRHLDVVLKQHWEISESRSKALYSFHNITKAIVLLIAF